MKRIAAIALVALAMLPAAPARADCTRLGYVTIGECRKKRKKKPQPPAQDLQRAPAAEQRLLEEVNEERRQRGLRLLVLDPNAREVARQHSRRMARRGREFHNEDLDSPETRQKLGYPRSIGENVGYGPGAGSVHEAFMGSDAHRANILGDYDRVGIGVIVDGRTYWITEVFTEGAADGGGNAILADGPGPRPRRAGRPAPVPAILETVSGGGTPVATEPLAPAPLPWGAMLGIVGASTLPGALRRSIRRRGRQAKRSSA